MSLDPLIADILGYCGSDDALSICATLRSSGFGKNGWGGRIRTYGTLYQKQLPYRLATPQRCGLGTMQRGTVQGENRKNMISFSKISLHPLCFGIGLAGDRLQKRDFAESTTGRMVSQRPD